MDSRRVWRHIHLCNCSEFGRFFEQALHFHDAVLPFQVTASSKVTSEGAQRTGSPMQDGSIDIQISADPCRWMGERARGHCPIRRKLQIFSGVNTSLERQSSEPLDYNELYRGIHTLSHHSERHQILSRHCNPSIAMLNSQ